MNQQTVIDTWLKIKNPQERRESVNQMLALLESVDLESQLSKSISNDLSVSEAGTSHRIICGDLNQVQINQAVDLVFTSPPYNANIAYDTYNDKLESDEYFQFLSKSIQKCNEWLSPGGRFVVNIRDITLRPGVREPVIVPLYECFKNLGYAYRGTHLWYKGREESSFAWGSFKSSNNPSIVDLFEYVFVFQKPGEHKKGADNIDKTEFIESVMGVWKIRPVKKIIGSEKKNIMQHPCPFPVELAKRVIKLYSHVGDWVLDPFGGVMTTSLAAAQSGRNSIGIDISQNYCTFGEKRLKKEFQDLAYHAKVFRT